jgi:hypothetical protein
MNEGRIELTEDAPPVDLECLIVENRGLAIEMHPQMGRVLVATQPLTDLYEPVLREQPALVCQQEDYMDYMEQFLQLPEELQVGLLDMFYQPLESPMGQSLVEPAKLLFLLGVLEDLVVLHQLLAILVTNGHQYQENLSAIPLFGSKFSHSCFPNVGYSSSSGYLEYTLLRPILNKGELVSFSYLADLFETPTNERRQLLFETKSFLCQCERCLGPDYCRCLPCPICCDDENTKKTFVPCQYQPHDLLEGCYWECPNCGMLETDYLRSIERTFEKTLQVLSREIEGNHDKESLAFNKRSSDYSPRILQELVQECQESLSPTHHLTVKALRLLISLATSHAYVQIKRLIVRGLPMMKDPRVHSIFRTSVDAGFQLVLACECVAAGCVGCYRDGGVPRHEPNYDRATPMRHICDNLLQLPVSWWPPLAVTMATRYLPIFKAKFQTLEDIERRLVRYWETKEATCHECGTHWEDPI